MVEANILSVSRVWSSLRSPSCHHSLLVSIHWVVSEESSDVFSESVALSYASSPSVYFHLQYCWRLNGGYRKQVDGISLKTPRKLGLEGTWRVHPSLLSAHGVTRYTCFILDRWINTKVISSSVSPAVFLSPSPPSFFLILLLMSKMFLLQFPVDLPYCHGYRAQIFPSPFIASVPEDFLLSSLSRLPSSSYTTALLSVFFIE